MKPNQRDDRLAGRLPNIGRYVTVKEFAAIMHVEVHVIYSWIKKHQLRGTYLIPESEVRRCTEDTESRAIKQFLERENRRVQLVTRPPPLAKRASMVGTTPDLDFVLGELRNKCTYLESENRRLMDQNLRLRATLRDELIMWESVLKGGQTLSIGQAGRHVSRLLGAVEYEGRDEGEDPMDYRERSIGGNLSRLLREKGNPTEAEPVKEIRFQDAPLQRKEGTQFSSDMVVNAMNRYEARVTKIVAENREQRSAGSDDED